jgi:hypothetical protein
MKIENANFLSDQQQLDLLNYLVSKQFAASAMGNWTFEHPEQNELGMAGLVQAHEIRQIVGLPRDGVISIGWQSKPNETTVILPMPVQGLEA